MLLEASDSKKYMEKQEREQTVQHGSSVLSKKKNTNIYFAIYLDDDSSNEISGIKAQEIAFNILEE